MDVGYGISVTLVEEHILAEYKKISTRGSNNEKNLLRIAFKILDGKFPLLFSVMIFSKRLIL